MKLLPVSPFLSSLTIASFLAGAVALAQDDGSAIGGLAERLIGLRGEVESLQGELEAQRQNHRNRMASLAQRRASLEGEVKNKQLQLRQLSRAIEDQKQAMKARNEQAESVAPLVGQIGELLRAFVQKAIPFQTSDRLAGIDELVGKVESGDISAPRALNRMWGLFEDEFRIAKENGLFTQEIVLDGKAQLAEVVRLGGVMMFYKSSADDSFGYVVRDGNKWRYQAATGQDVERIDNLFKSFEKQLRTGFFEIPGALTVSK